MPLVLFPVLLLLLPVIEIAGFILVGGWLGLWPTLGLVIVNAVVGAALLRRQGLSVLGRIRTETAAGRVPAGEVMDGMMIVVAGILLLVPGFVSDIAGYLLFVPPVRAAIRRFLAARVVMRTSAGPMRPTASERPATREPQVVELERGDYERRPDASTPWRGA